MYKYCVYGLKIVSDIEFAQLVTVQESMPEAPEIRIEAVTVPEEIKQITDKKYEFGDTFSWLSNDTTWLVVENGERIGYCLTGGGHPTYLQTYILGFGMSMLAMQRGILAIHCSAVADENGAVLIAGESGAGKSTVTTAFLEKGYRLMADDMAFVETEKNSPALAKPAFPFQKLCRNVALEKGYLLENLIYINEEKDKFLVPYAGDFKTDAVPVKAFIMLGVVGGDSVVTQEIRGFDRFHVYANNLFLRHLLQKDKYNPAIGQKCLEMAAVVPTYFIGRPLNGDTTAEVIAEALGFVEGKMINCR
uniref:hypothetical protein n=1 Tax=Acetatifactor sp. TaxID=1872090 RepID=UPI00405628A1